MYENLNLKLKEAAAYSNEIIKLAKAHDQRTFEFAKGAKKYFAIFGEYYANSYETLIESYRLLELTYRVVNNNYEVAKIYKKMEEEVIPESFGNLFKKMIEVLRVQSKPSSSSNSVSSSTTTKPTAKTTTTSSTNTTKTVTYSNTSSERVQRGDRTSYGTARAYESNRQDRGTASIANPYLNGGRKY